MHTYDIDKIRALPILDVAEKLGLKVQKKGIRYFARCLWHEDRNPSLVIWDDKTNHCHCFACDKSWDAIDMVMKHEGVDFQGACKWLEGKGYCSPYPPPFPPNGEGGTLRVNKYQLRSNEVSPLPSVANGNSLPLVGPEAHSVLPLKTPVAPNGGRAGDRGCSRGLGLGLRDNFFTGMIRLFDVERVRRVWRDYEIGGYDDGRLHDCTLFPSITAEGRVLDYKLQWYYSERGPLFLHADRYQTRWLGRQLMGEDFQHHDCLFGEHLLRKYPNRTVGLVESPKNACVCACQWPELVWVATGNKGLLRRDMLLPLRNRRVLVLPDYDAWGEWQQKLQGMQDVACFHIPQGLMQEIGKLGAKADVADLVAPSLLPQGGNR